MTVAQAINKIIHNYGMVIMDSPDKVQSMILDYVTGYEQEKQIFILSCQKGILSYAHEILLLKDSEKIKTMARKAVIKLEQDAFMSEEYAILSVNLLLEGMGISFRLKSRQKKKIG